MSRSEVREMGVSDARANMTEVIAEVRLLGHSVVLTRRDKPQAVLVSVEDYEQAKGLRRLVELLKAEHADVYEELMATAVLKPRTKVRRRKSDDVL